MGHKEDSLRWHKKMRASRIAEGLCVSCPKDSKASRPVPGNRRCLLCLVRWRLYMKRLLHKRKENSQCVRCGKRPAEPGRKKCPECKESDRQYKARLRERGLCPRCWGKRKAEEGRWCCGPCRDAELARKARHRLAKRQKPLKGEAGR